VLSYNTVGSELCVHNSRPYDVVRSVTNMLTWHELAAVKRGDADHVMLVWSELYSVWLTVCRRSVKR